MTVLLVIVVVVLLAAALLGVALCLTPPRSANDMDPLEYLEQERPFPPRGFAPPRRQWDPLPSAPLPPRSPHRFVGYHQRDESGYDTTSLEFSRGTEPKDAA